MQQVTFKEKGSRPFGVRACIEASLRFEEKITPAEESVIHMSHDWHSLVLVIFVTINGRRIMQKPRAQIINFENKRNISKSIVFVSLLIHYFATCICSKL